MILQAFEKISTQRSRCTMLSLGSPEKALSISANLEQLRSQIGWILSLGRMNPERLVVISRAVDHITLHSVAMSSRHLLPRLEGYDFQVMFSISCSSSLLVESTLELTCDSDAAKVSNVPCRKHQTYE